MGNEDTAPVVVDEVVILRKFEGNSEKDEDEIERVTVENGLVVSHNRYENGELVGPVEGDESLAGKDIGSLLSKETAEEV